MSFARLRLIVAALLFFGWLGWLAYAVSQKGTVQIVSRAQTTGAPLWVVATITVGPDGLPNVKATVKETLKGDAITGEIEVANLRSALIPVASADGTRTPIAGDYLLALERVGDRTYRVAGLPRSPGYEAREAASPLIYPWTDDVRKQIGK